MKDLNKIADNNFIDTSRLDWKDQGAFNSISLTHFFRVTSINSPMLYAALNYEGVKTQINKDRWSNPK